MVSAELALAIPALLLVLMLCMVGLGIGADHLRATDAARAGARAAARGDDPAEARAAAAVIAPSGSQIVVSVVGEQVTVQVTAPARRMLPGVPGASASAVSTLEPAAGSS